VVRHARTSLLAALVLLAAVAAGGGRAAVSATPPSCAGGPITIGDATWGTPCDDTILAQPQVATVYGGGGDDTILAAPILAGASCPDGCSLGIGSQTFDGGPGDDIVYGERGNDTLNGGGGNDQLFGGIGDDLLRGGPGNDRLSGGFGADSIDGQSGDDYVRGDGTADTIVDSEGGSDTLSYTTGVTPGFPNNAAYPDFAAYPGFPGTGGERGVYVDLGANLADNGVAPFGGGVDAVEGADFETVIGTPFSDFIVGSGTGETINGGGGGDVILGGGGNDTLRGGADGDHLDGGAGANALDGGAGNDHCQSPTSGTSCESGVNGGGVVLRDPTKVSVGFMAPENSNYSQLYLTDGNGGDIVTASYAPGPPATVTFDLGAGSAGSFDQSPAASGGCNTVSAIKAVCTLSLPLDSIVLAGVGGNDTLQAPGFPTSTSVVVAGGEGGDSLTGGDLSEDVLADGPDANGPGNDELNAFGRDDALLNNGGADRLFGGAGNDLFLSNSICDGDLLNGGTGRDNASWAKFKASGVDARIGAGDAGRQGVGGAPDCGSGALDSLQEVEDLEGTSSGDVLGGGPGPNQLLGWSGPDEYSSGAGADTILANSGDFDPTIECGGDNDTALIDRPPFGDLAAADCESVQEADPNSFRIVTELPAPAPTPPAEPPAPVPPPSGAGPLAPAPSSTVPAARLPRTRITRHPDRVLTTTKGRRRVVFAFAASEAGAGFRCRLDGRPFRPCRSPRAYLVATGRHVVRIVAVDAAGAADPTPARFSFAVRSR
jgi:Ca2+-binding RTX toxin-like protein